MDSRLLPLLALLGAAGLKPSHWKGSPSQEPGTSPEEEHPLPGSSEPRPGSSTGHPSASSFPSTLQPPSPTMSSADSEVSPAGGPSGAVAKKQDSIVGTAVGRTQPPTLDLGGTERTGPPRALGTSWLPSPMSPSVATRLLTSFPTSALLPKSTSPKEAAAPTSLASEEFSRSGPEGKTLQGWLATGPSVLQDTWEWVSNPARRTLTPEPGSKSTAGAASAQSETSSVVFVEDPRTPTAGEPRPSGAGSWMSQESMPSPHTAENQGTLTPTRPPAVDTSDPASTGSSTPSETLGPAGEAATASIMSTRQVSPRDQGSLGTGPELLSQKPGGSQSHVQTEVMPGLDPEAEPEDQGVVVGSLSPGTTLSQSLAGMGHMLVVMEETVVPDSVKACTTTVLDSHIGQGAEKETLPYSPALPSFAATPNQGTDGTEVTPYVSSFSRGATVPRGLVGSAVPPSDSDHALYGSSSTPGPSLPPSFVGTTRLTDPTKGLGALDIGQDNSLASATHQHRMDLPPDSNAGPFWDMDNPATATGVSWGFWNPPGPTEHVSRSFEPSPPGPTPFPLRGGLPGSGPSAEETWTSPAESGWQVPSTLGGVQKVLSVHTEQSGSKGSTSVAAPRQTSQAATDGTFVGMASEKTHPRVNWHEVPSLTGSPTGSETALLSMEGVTLNSAHAVPHPELVPSWVTALPTSAAPTSEVTAASTWLRWTLRPGTPPARTQGWEWERDSMENSATEAPTPSPHHGGPVQATGTSGLLESSWQTWPPMPAPEPGSVSQSGPAIASTWLLAPMQEEAPTLPAPAKPDDARSRGRHVFVVENQPPLVKAAFLHVPCELVLAMEYSRNFQNPRSAEYQGLVLSINETVAPLLASLPGFQRLEVKTIRPGNVVVEFDALFQAEASGLWMALNRSWLSERLPSGLRVADARVLRSGTLERHLDLCAILFSCHAGYECTAGENGDAICTSLCHRDYCQNQGICTHEVNHVPVCQCPVGSDFWFLGMRCNYKVTQQGLLGIACGLLLSLVVVGTAIATLVIRRVRMLLLEARADQTKSSYRRFCRLDDVSAHYWSEPWLASASSLDNPAFSNSEELLHLQILDTNCGCPDNCMDPSGSCKQLQDTPCVSAAGRPSFHYNWDISSNSVNDPMIDSGKASEVSISSWPLEPIQWSPFPALHKLSGQQVDQSRRPHSYCEGMELVNLERSWTA